MTENTENSKIKSEGDGVSLEYQRYGRNKETVINHTYINRGEYRNKFDSITDNINVNRILYAKAKEMLNHRSGTKHEDMYWIDGATGAVLASALNEQQESGIQYVSNEKISEPLYSLYVGEFLDNGYTEFEAQWKALEKLKENYDIDFWEVKP